MSESLRGVKWVGTRKEIRMVGRRYEQKDRHRQIVLVVEWVSEQL
jgi:hypothetical protein